VCPLDPALTRLFVLQALLIFFVAMVIMLVLDCILLIVSMSNCTWRWCGNGLAYIVVSIIIEIIGAVLAHRLRSGHHSHVLIHI
jgi:steroid 5-alpha reductase family enzyme